MPLGKAAWATRTVSAGIGASGDTWSDMAHLLTRQDKSAETIVGHYLCNRPEALLCSQVAPAEHFWEFASRVSVGFTP